MLNHKVQCISQYINVIHPLTKLNKHYFYMSPPLFFRRKRGGGQKVVYSILYMYSLK